MAIAKKFFFVRLHGVIKAEDRKEAWKMLKAIGEKNELDAFAVSGDAYDTIKEAYDKGDRLYN